MDSLKDFVSNAGKDQNGQGGIMDKVNSLAGGGKESEKTEDALDKGVYCVLLLTFAYPELTIHPGVDAFQQYVLKEGDQSNESAAEQAKDEQISDFVRKQYKSVTGKDFPAEDKETKLGL